MDAGKEAITIRLLLAALFVVSIVAAARQRQRDRQGASFTSGRVVGHETRSGPEGEPVLHPRIEVTTLDGEIIGFTSELGTNTMRWPVGSEVDARINEGKLEHDDQGFETQSLLIVIAFGLLVILCATNDTP